VGAVWRRNVPGTAGWHNDRVTSDLLRRLAWSAWFVSIAGVVGALVLTVRNGGGVWWIAPNALPLAGCATVGLVLCLRIPGNPIGRLFLAIAVSLGVALFTDAYSARALALPANAAAAVIANGLIAVPLVLLPALVLLFPEGRVPSPRWRPVAVLWGTASVLVVVGFLLSPGPMGLDSDPSRRNPIGLTGVIGSAMNAMTTLAIATVFAVMAAAAVSLVVRFRRATGDERQQLKWFGSAAACLALVGAVSIILLSPLLPAGSSHWANVAVTLGFAVTSAMLVVATGIAILRYRLYQIDVIIRRTLVYAILVAVLAATYLAGVLVIDAALGAITGQSGALAETLSTLVVAGMFQPVRVRIQRAVDRRFYRRRYDATQTLELFSSRLREQIDLDALHDELMAVLHETVQPSRVGLWLRAADDRPATRDPV
jgi:hypothetical protein